MKIYDDLLLLANGIELKYEEELGRFRVIFVDENISHITFSEQIAYVLGYEEGKPIRNGQLARFGPDLQGGVSHIFCYINDGILENVIVGDKLTSLVDIIPVTKRPGRLQYERFQNIQFHKVVAKEIQEIEIELRSLEGRPIPFMYGTVICVLLFRKTMMF